MKEMISKEALEYIIAFFEDLSQSGEKANAESIQKMLGNILEIFKKHRSKVETKNWVILKINQMTCQPLFEIKRGHDLKNVYQRMIQNNKNSDKKGRTIRLES